MIQEQRPYRDDRGRTETVSDPELREPRGRIDTEERTETEFREPRTREREAYREPYAEPDTEVSSVYSASGINILAGLWLILAPFALGYANLEAALWNSVIVGIAVAVMAIVRVMNPAEYEGISWTNFVLGIWLIVSPWVLGVANVQEIVWNNIIVGVVVLLLAGISAMATHRVHEPAGRGRRPVRRR